MGHGKTKAGIGLSGQVTAYSPAVCVGNWVEERAVGGVAAGPLPDHAPFQGSTLTKDSYPPQGRYGPGILEASKREDLLKKYACVNKDVLFDHGDPLEEPVRAYASVYSCAYGPMKEKLVPKLDSYLWSGNGKLDRRVPLEVTTPQSQRLVLAKQAAWREERRRGMYITTSGEALECTAALSRGTSFKRESCRPQAEGGQTAQVGRKAKGTCALSFDKTHVKSELRRPLHPKSTFVQRYQPGEVVAIVP